MTSEIYTWPDEKTEENYIPFLTDDIPKKASTTENEAGYWRRSPEEIADSKHHMPVVISTLLQAKTAAICRWRIVMAAPDPPVSSLAARETTASFQQVFHIANTVGHCQDALNGALNSLGEPQQPAPKPHTAQFEKIERLLQATTNGEAWRLTLLRLEELRGLRDKLPGQPWNRVDEVQTGLPHLSLLRLPSSMWSNPAAADRWLSTQRETASKPRAHEKSLRTTVTFRRNRKLAPLTLTVLSEGVELEDDDDDTDVSKLAAVLSVLEGKGDKQDGGGENNGDSGGDDTFQNPPPSQDAPTNLSTNLSAAQFVTAQNKNFQWACDVLQATERVVLDRNRRLNMEDPVKTAEAWALAHLILENVEQKSNRLPELMKVPQSGLNLRCRDTNIGIYLYFRRQPILPEIHRAATQLKHFDLLPDSSLVDALNPVQLHNESFKQLAIGLVDENPALQIFMCRRLIEKYRTSLRLLRDVVDALLIQSVKKNDNNNNDNDNDNNDNDNDDENPTRNPFTYSLLSLVLQRIMQAIEHIRGIELSMMYGILAGSPGYWHFALRTEACREGLPSVQAIVRMIRLNFRCFSARCYRSMLSTLTDSVVSQLERVVTVNNVLSRDTLSVRVMKVLIRGQWICVWVLLRQLRCGEEFVYHNFLLDLQSSSSVVGHYDCRWHRIK